mmetsp:Transcript_30377/g.34527  ORF Transcript_30377/g.34527 Transcript_30377/m.34527 type:complete len:84 (+) Transcript_30377:266-517(+)
MAHTNEYQAGDSDIFPERREAFDLSLEVIISFWINVFKTPNDSNNSAFHFVFKTPDIHVDLTSLFRKRLFNSQQFILYALDPN